MRACGMHLPDGYRLHGLGHAFVRGEELYRLLCAQSGCLCVSVCESVCVRVCAAKRKERERERDTERESARARDS